MAVATHTCMALALTSICVWSPAVLGLRAAWFRHASREGRAAESMWRTRRQRTIALRSSSIETSYLTSGETEASELVRRVATALRDGERTGSLVEACRLLKRCVSNGNNAAKLSAEELAASIEQHRDVYQPLLEFDSVAATRIEEMDRESATVVSSLASASGQVSDVVWSLSLGDKRWMIDAVSVTPPPDEADACDEFSSMAALTSPKWVAQTVLNALRRVDEPDKNAGCDVALSFVSSDNPSSSLTREIFRSYLDDDAYPYGILTRWTEMRLDADVLFDNDQNPKTGTVDVTLIDDRAHDNVKWTVTLDMSKAEDRGWLIDRVWCHDY